MTDGMVFTGSVLLVVVTGSRIVIRGKVCLMHMLVPGWRLVRVMHALLRHGGMATSALRTHGNRFGQRIAAEQRQPDGQKYGNKFSDRTEHVSRVAKIY